jgi:hypothetical protein
MANMIQFVITKGEELGIIYMILCLVERGLIRNLLSSLLISSSRLECFGDSLASFWQEHAS